MSRDDIAIDGAGNPLPYSPDEVRRIVVRAVEHGDLVAAILRTDSGDLACQVFGPPSRELLEVLEQVTEAYRRAIQFHA